jgi:hypothetical protein
MLATPAEFEPALAASERPVTYALDRSTNGIGLHYSKVFIKRN